MSVSFVLKDPSKSKSAIKCIVWFGGKRYNLATGASVQTEFWDTQKKRCVNPRKYPDGKSINQRLNGLNAALAVMLNRYESNYHIPDVYELRKDLEIQLKGGSGSTESFTTYIEKEIELEKNTKTERTIKGYTTALNKLKEYEVKHGTITFKTVDIQFYRKFRTWLGKQKKKDESFYTLNYFGTIVKVIIYFYKKAYQDKVHSFTGHLHPEFKMPSETADSVYLSMDELKKIRDVEIDDYYVGKTYPELLPHQYKRVIESAKLVRNKFLLCALTGLRISDIIRLTPDNISDVIRITPKKGAKKNQEVVIPIQPMLRDLIDGDCDIYTPISEQKINKHIKKICKHAGITDPIQTVTTLCNGKRLTTTHEKWELVSTHTGRRSFATNALKGKVEAESIMMITGHASYKNFKKYVKITQEENAELMKAHPFFN